MTEQHNVSIASIAWAGSTFLAHDENEIEQLQALYARYISQLSTGCSSSRCSEVLCHTGRVNSSKSPVRRYTPRSSRAIALAICAGPHPRKHLCLYGGGESGHAAGKGDKDPGPQDQSSLMQLLSDCTSVKSCMASDCSLVQELQHQRVRLNHVETHMAPSDDCSHIMSNAEILASIFPCIEWLLGKLPSQRMAVWEMVDRDVVSKGYEVPVRTADRPNDNVYNSWLAVLDVINHELYLRLLGRIVTLMARRVSLEHHLKSCRDTGEDGRSCDESTTAKRGIIALFVTKWCKAHQNDGALHAALVVWLKRLFTQHWDGTALISAGTVPHAALQLLEQLRLTPGIQSTLPNKYFRLPMVQSRVGEVDLATAWLAGNDQAHSHLFDFPFLFTESQIFLFFRTINHLNMRTAYSATLAAQGLRDRTSQQATSTQEPAQLLYEEEHYFLLYVSRRNITKDTFDQVWQRRQGEMRRPLRVRMGADELDIGHDLGGVQVEFFQVLCRQVFDEEAQMFTTNAETGLSFIRAGSLQPLHHFELFGTLVALSLYNGITLPIRLPDAFYHLLIRPDEFKFDAHLAVELIRDGWPTEARSCQAILEHDIEDLEFSFTLEANGLRITALPAGVLPSPLSDARIGLKVADAFHIHRQAKSSALTPGDITNLAEAWPGWKLEVSQEKAAPVTSDNKAQYISSYASWLIFLSVEPQMRALIKGFAACKLIDPRTMLMLGPRNVKNLVEGTDHLDMSDLRTATRYDGYEAKSKYIRNFWSIVNSWSEEKQKQLLKFVTAAERIPITGAKSLTFIIKRSNPESLDSLPTSSTCFGTLMLPRYGSGEILAEKLNLALKYGSEGFGTG